MQFVTRLIVMTRARQLQRQFRQIERNIGNLSNRARERLGLLALREVGQASKSDFPHLYGTEPDERYSLWGKGTELGFGRAQSDNAEVALRGIALWLAVAYHETKDSPHAGMQPQHRQILRVLRELRETGGKRNHDAASAWTEAGATA